MVGRFAGTLTTRLLAIAAQPPAGRSYRRPSSFPSARLISGLLVIVVARQACHLLLDNGVLRRSPSGTCPAGPAALTCCDTSDLCCSSVRRAVAPRSADRQDCRHRAWRRPPVPRLPSRRLTNLACSFFSWCCKADRRWDCSVRWSPRAAVKVCLHVLDHGPAIRRCLPPGSACPAPVLLFRLQRLDFVLKPSRHRDGSDHSWLESEAYCDLQRLQLDAQASSVPGRSRRSRGSTASTVASWARRLALRPLVGADLAFDVFQRRDT